MPDSPVIDANEGSFASAFAYEIRMHVLLHGDEAAMGAYRPPAARKGSTASWVPWLEMDQALKSACQVLGDEHAALRIGMGLTAAHMGALGFAMSTAPDGLTAAQLFEELQALCVTGLSWRHVRHGAQLQISAPIHRTQAASYPLWSFLLAFRLNLMRRSCSRPLVPVRVALPCKAPPIDLSVLRDFVGAPIQFGQSQYEEWYAYADVCTPNVHGADEIYRLMAALARRELKERHDSREKWMSRLKSAVFEALDHGQRPTLALLSTRLSAQMEGGPSLTSARQLQRRLNAMQCGFRELVTQVRRERTLMQLKLTDRPFADIAAEAGYSELSSFHRAVRRWTGSTPMRIRSQGAGCQEIFEPHQE